MSWIIDFVLLIGLMLGLLLGGMWIPFAIGISALLAVFITDGLIGFRAIGLVTWGSINSFTLTAIPMFILMAEILIQSGVSHRFYVALSKVVHKLPGGLLQTNIVGCAIFAAISGSSVATAGALGTVALPQLENMKYDHSMAAGSLAAGGTLGILIPPSIALIIYGSITETSIARLFMAGIIPGFLLASFYMIYIGFRACFQPGIAPVAGVTISFYEKMRASLELFPILILIVIVLGGIYFGLTTPTEAGALGSFISIIIGLIWGDLTPSRFRVGIVNSIKVSVTLLFIVLMALIFAYAVQNAAIASNLANWVLNLGLGKNTFILVIIVIYSILGCVMAGTEMIVLTVPVLFPIIIAYGFDPVWYGITLVLLVEMGQVTPPFGMNLFVIQSISGWPLNEVVKGSMPYWAIILSFVIFVTVFPEIVLWLPEHMFIR